MNSNAIFSQLVPASLGILYPIQYSHPDVWQRLHTPVESNSELYSQYQYIIQSGTLMEFISLVINSKNSHPDLHVLFSMAGSVPVGVLLYTLDLSEGLISNIKTFTFKSDSKSNMVLVRDVINFIKDAVTLYDVSWEARKDHTHRREYETFVKKYNVTFQDSISDSEYVSFFIPK